ncbi:serine protease 48 precursor [Nasonia vitripennis]|uniref:chymotrypsin n=1 Tax=Nasonia vitripennis TaxID=7425 RepID=A0A7M6UME3_NASVI|nr:serine protease 48 precursor [Nasonia vitripennis]
MLSLKLIVLSCLAGLACAAYRPFFGQAKSLADFLKFNRIIGGQDALKGEFPHQVSLQWGYPPFVAYSHLCGGSIIDESWILTAAHCVNTLPRSGEFVVRAGKHFIKSNEATEQISLTTEVFIHKNYRGEVSPFDIALIKLATPLVFNDYVSAIDLPQPNVVPQGKVILSGWGSISKTRQAILPNVLQKVTLPLIDIGKCRRALRMLGERGEVHETNICTGPLTGGLTACSGDSGGPLISRNENGTTEIVGIVSWGIVPCGGVGAPAVFVRVSAFIDWINSIITTY